MSPEKTVTIIGGGIAGLSSAVFLNELGFQVTLIEASPKLGGRAYSFFDKERGMFFDNGQHILAGWYKNTFEYLNIIGSYDLVNFQKGLEINFIDTEKKVFKLSCPDIEPPMNLLQGLLKFKAFGLKDKFALKNIKKLLNDDNDLEDKFINVKELLTGINQTQKLIRYFWEPFVLAVFNTRLENISVKIFLNVLKTGFNSNSNSTLVIPKVNLNELLIDKAVEYFKKNNTEVLLNKRVDKIIMKEDATGDKIIDCVTMEDDSKIYSDYYISAVPFFAFKKLFDDRVYYDNGFKSELLLPSGIVSIHLFFDEDISPDIIPENSFGMTGLIGTVVQWIFKRSERHLSLVISGADDLQVMNMDAEEIYKLCINELSSTITNFNKLKLSGYKVIKEKRATFIPDHKSQEFRQKHLTGYNNFFVAGDWTDTGLPATIESAVKSARICTQEILNYN
ncbi:MAG: hydroxysqualene dehydroxylase HpnE [bacterium]|nr:hydroxysqualene dehydroxylase HpnE [bacterium]